MTRVSVIGTFHGESGLVTSSELVAVLESLQPEVIFAEMPLAKIDRYVDGSHGNLESIAVARYREGHEVPVIPVDLPEPEHMFFENHKDLEHAVRRTSPDYRQMMEYHCVMIREGGFPYLNSDQNIQLWTAIGAEIEATVDHMGQARFRETFDLWMRAIEARDVGMMKNIEGYCVRHRPAHGVFPVGAAHLGSIREKARAGSAPGSSVVRWEFPLFAPD